MLAVLPDLAGVDKRILPVSLWRLSGERTKELSRHTTARRPFNCYRATRQTDAICRVNVELIAEYRQEWCRLVAPDDRLTPSEQR